MNRKIISRHYYAVLVELASPLNVSGGGKLFSAHDIMRNWDGVPFIPGTSLAGAFRNYLMLKTDQPGMMGYANDEKGNMSSLFISDLYFREEPIVSLRDCVALDNTKSVIHKFDMEIVETGVQGILYFNYIVRDPKEAEEFQDLTGMFLQGIQNGEIRFGGKKNRGFGRLNIVSIYKRHFDEKCLSKWMEFEKNEKLLTSYEKEYSFKTWLQSQKKLENRYVKVSVPLRLTGGISIRRYTARPERANYEHITSYNNKKEPVPVIPGSSWAGAIRSDAADILRMAGCAKEQIETLIKDWFGYVEVGKENSSAEGAQSIVVFAESQIEDAASIIMTRNRIDRFDASTEKGALYTEISSFGGHTSLDFWVKKVEKKKYKALLGLLSLVVQDIQKGYLPIGGLVAVGRGIFEADPEQPVIWSEEVEEGSMALYKCITVTGGEKYEMV